jgi:ligand-binding sensor domain-containing protein/class 3 adenylate cyclase/predicted metal-dependent HD superfamily phosphohydrolase
MKKFLLTILLVQVFFGFSQSKYFFRNYTISNGLSQSVITAIVQDDFGFIWIGTQDGLNKFDGQTFEIYTSDNTKGLESEHIYTAFKSISGLLWFGTANGLTSYDCNNERFETYQIEGNFALQVETITEDLKGNIYLGTTSTGLFFLNRKTGKINPLKTNLPSQKINHILFHSEGKYFVSTEDKGLYVLDVATGLCERILISGKKNPLVVVNKITPFNKNQYILGTNQGLYLLSSDLKKSSPFLMDLDKNYGLIEIADLLIESENKMYVASKTQGLFTVNFGKNTTKIEQHTSDFFQKNSLLFNAINVLFRDKKGIFWTGTERGIGSFDPIKKGFLGVGLSANLENGLPSPSVWCFAEDEKEKFVFIGTEKSISRLNKKTGRFEHFHKKQTLGKISDLSDSYILSLFVINENKLLVGASDGFYLLDIYENNYSFEKINYKNIANGSNFERIYNIVFWKEDYYFLATKGGVILYNHKLKTFKVFEHDEKNIDKTIGSGICRLVYKDKKGKIWFATSSGGLYELIDDKEPLIVPSKYNNLISKYSKDYISSIYDTEDGLLWLGTMGSGLLKLDLSGHLAELFNKKNGLPNNVIYGVLSDGIGNLWLSTNKGISKFDLKRKKFTNYTEKEGLMSNEFNLGAYIKLNSGDLMFGGIYGYNYFNPRDMNFSTISTDVIFTKFKLDAGWIKPNDPTAILNQSISKTESITLSYKQRSFTLKFMALDFANPELVNYKYILEGSDEGEIFIGKTNQIHFNSLQPGDYVLKVYARQGDSKWSENPAVLEIYLAAPFWKKAWFWFLIIILVGLALFALIRKQIDQERREQVRLEMKIAERTKEIREQNIKIEKQKKTIEDKKNSLEEQKHLLEIEKEKTEKLLKNIIPESTYHELKTKGKASARGYKTVSVLFTDFVGFTKIAERMKPADLVNELDIYFRKFDEIIIKNNLEKIKTIGDAYMCAGGVPVRNNTNPIDACLAALQIQDCLAKMRIESATSGREIWDLRLGINTGEVTAGVIGSEKLAYDVWGSTVNKAQRMEMLGEPGKVTISGETFKFIEPYFVCTFRGKVRAKSKSLIDMYTVDSIKPELSINEEGIFPNERFQQIVNLHFYSSINYYKAERHIMKVLEKKLSPKLHYHSISHTKDVCRAIERIALLEGVTDEGLFLLKSAATYHDAGFVESYEKNEPVGARMAEEILPNYGYSKEHIDQIKKLIYVTQIPHKPTSKLEEIICDADLDYLGRDDFHEISDKLRLELREHGKIDSDRKWDEIQVSFLTNHKYFTETAKKTREEKKAKHLEDIKIRLEKNEYVD